MSVLSEFLDDKQIVKAVSNDFATVDKYVDLIKTLTTITDGDLEFDTVEGKNKVTAETSEITATRGDKSWTFEVFNDDEWIDDYILDELNYILEENDITEKMFIEVLPDEDFDGDDMYVAYVDEATFKKLDEAGLVYVPEDLDELDLDEDEE